MLTGMPQKGQAPEREAKKTEDHLCRGHWEAAHCLDLAASLPLPSPFYQISTRWPHCWRSCCCSGCSWLLCLWSCTTSAVKIRSGMKPALPAHVAGEVALTDHMVASLLSIPAADAFRPRYVADTVPTTHHLAPNGLSGLQTAGGQQDS